MIDTRPPAVAGTFYPASPHALRRAVHSWLDAAAQDSTARPCAIIAPHAGFIYSGPVAATAYAHVAALRGHVKTVVLLGPAHHVRLRGLAASGAHAFATPLGTVPVDGDGVARACTLSWVRVNDAAHAPEHSLEVQLPFLQEVLTDFSIVPLLTGTTSDTDTAAVLEALWHGNDMLIVASSDLSHYSGYDAARAHDRSTAHAIEALDAERIGPCDACGYTAIRAVLRLARAHGLVEHTLDLRSSGDTAGARDRVVGYGAFEFVGPLDG